MRYVEILAKLGFTERA